MVSILHVISNLKNKPQLSLHELREEITIAEMVMTVYLEGFADFLEN